MGQRPRRARLPAGRPPAGRALAAAARRPGRPPEARIRTERAVDTTVTQAESARLGDPEADRASDGRRRRAARRLPVEVGPRRGAARRRPAGRGSTAGNGGKELAVASGPHRRRGPLSAAARPCQAELRSLRRSCQRRSHGAAAGRRPGALTAAAASEHRGLSDSGPQ